MAGFGDLGEGVYKMFLAGVGAVAMGAEKSQEIVGELGKKGELTVEQGKIVNEELRHRFEGVANDTSDSLLRAKLRGMTPEERAAWIRHAQQVSDDLEAQVTKVEVEEGPATDEPSPSADTTTE